MKTKALIVIAAILAISISVLIFPLGAVGVVVGMVSSAITILVLRQGDGLEREEKKFLLQVFLLALILRTVVAAIIFGFGLEATFAPDSTGYDYNGWLTAERWRNGATIIEETTLAANRKNAFAVINYGMEYVVAAVYYFVGRNPFAVQMISAVTGAATAAIMYLSAKVIFRNTRVARITALIVAVLPAMIVWSAQIIKDGFIVFLLALGMLMILQLQRRLSYYSVAILLLIMIGIFTMRFYLFPLLVVAAVGGFLISAQTSLRGVIGRCAALGALGLALSFSGVLSSSQSQVEAIDLARIQASRRSASAEGVAGSGFNSEADVSTASGAITTLPIGLATLYAAPFPWQMIKITQIMLLPEMIMWWALLPLTFIGLWYCLKNRFRENISILLFVTLLSLFYALSQGNLGTLYRQRTQIQVFLVMFSAVGLTMQLEKREVAKIKRLQHLQLIRENAISIK